MYPRATASYPLLAACALARALAACGGEHADAPPGTAGSATTVEFVDPPKFVGHQTVTRVVAHDPAGVTRVELYLDDMRVAAVEFAPFDAAWDATGFAAGPHALRALAYTSDGRTGDATIQIRIDHTEPSVSAAASARRDEPFAIDASDDEAGVARVVVQRGDATLATLTAPPYQFAWPGGACGNVGLRIIAIDRVGNQRTIDTTVAAVDTQDLDCDGDPQIAFGGGDCDDGDPAFSSHAVDSGASVADLNCDGVPGTDADRDGVPSTATGGTDCNDADATSHAAWPGWTGRPLHLVRQAGGTHSPAFVAMNAIGTQLDMAFVDGGVLYHGASTLLADGAVTPVAPEQVAASVDDAPEHHPVVLQRGDNSPAIVFVADGGLRVATRAGAADWAITTIDPAAGVQLGRVEAVGDFTGAFHLVYEAAGDSPSSIRYATNRGGSWSIQTLPEGTRALESPKLAVDGNGRPHVIYEAASQVRHAVLSGGTWMINTVSADNSVVSRYALGFDPFGLLRLVAVVRGGLGRDLLLSSFELNGFALGDAAFASVPGQIDELAFNHGDLVLQLHDLTTSARSVQAWTLDGTSQDLRAGSLVGATRPTSTDLRVVVAVPGVGLVVAGRNRSIAAALDPSGGADLDCNGTP